MSKVIVDDSLIEWGSREDRKDGKVMVYHVRPQSCGGWIIATNPRELVDCLSTATDGGDDDEIVEVKTLWMTREEIEGLPEFPGW